MNHSINLNRFPLRTIRGALALSQVLLRGDVLYGTRVGLRNRLRCIGFYFTAGGIPSLYITLNRSGTGWFQLALHMALDLAAGGDGSYEYENGLFFPSNGMPYKKFDWRTPLGTHEKAFSRQGLPTYTRQIYWHSHNPFSILRNARLKKMRIVVQVRNILDSMESEFFKAKGDPTGPLSDEAFDDFPWDTFLADKIDFFNSWGDVLLWHESIHLLHYEDLVRDPVAGQREIAAFWRLDIPEECSVESIRLTSKDEMRKHIPENEWNSNPRVSFRGEEFRGIVPKSLKRHMLGIIDRDLVYDLGCARKPDIVGISK